MEIMKRDEEIKKLNEQMKFFKLELINRENNFNKLFNANPNIGTLNSLDYKVIPYSSRGRYLHLVAYCLLLQPIRKFRRPPTTASVTYCWSHSLALSILPVFLLGSVKGWFENQASTWFWFCSSYSNTCRYLYEIIFLLAHSRRWRRAQTKKDRARSDWASQI